MIVINKRLRDELQEKLVALTRDLILIPSIPSRIDDRRRCFEFIKNHLESIEGIEVREFEDKGIPSLIAAPKGIIKPKILLCGHLDVITHPDIAIYRSVIKDGRIYGPGAGDMKGALAILLEVFRAIHSRAKGVSLGIAITSDEETGGESGIGYLFNKVGVRCSLALIPDGGSLNKVTVAEKGILHLKVTCKGKSAHAARPWLGDNPITKLMDRLSVLREFFEKQHDKHGRWHSTCSVTMISTENQQVNRIALDATATLDIRFVPPFSVEKMLAIVKDKLGEEADLEVIISAEPTSFPHDPDFEKITKKITSKDIELVKDDGGSDARFIAHYGIPVIISRPLVGNLHAVDEWIDIASMVDFYQIYEQYLSKKLL